MEKIIIYVGQSHGESESTGNPYHVYKFFQLFTDKGVVRYKQIDLFAKKRLEGCGAIDFGSIVNLKFVDSDDIGGRPVLVGIDVLDGCPYDVVGE